MELQVIARIRSDFPTKFGIPRQSGLVKNLRSLVVFEPRFADTSALRGLADFSHIWLIWGFSEVKMAEWSPTVRPPRLGGNVRVGVFATRSPFRPNPLGLSCVELISVDDTSKNGPSLLIAGADLMDGTPIYDIKPYLPSSDCILNALGGFTDKVDRPLLEVVFPEDIEKQISPQQLETLRCVLALDPRPAYQKDADRIYGFSFAQYQVKFVVKGKTLEVIQLEGGKS